MEQKQIHLESTYLGMEIGSTRIKAVLMDDTYAPIASGGFSWENRFENGYWTYDLEDVQKGVQAVFADLARDVEEKFGIALSTVGAMGISGMMHGYLVFDKDDQLLVPFRTWRNTTTAPAASELTALFDFNIPQRWSIAHIYQAILNGEPHVPNIAHLTTVSGYIHYLLTGNRVVGMCEASGMFPVVDGGYDLKKIEEFNRLIKTKGYDLSIEKILPVPQMAGEKQSVLSEEGAKWLDPTGTFKPGVPICPPEGDGGTGMIATNTVLPGHGNISAGTSVFSMLVLDEPMKDVYEEIDVVTTPDGSPVAMVHSNNGCSELDGCVHLFEDFLDLLGQSMDKSELYGLLYKNAMTAESDAGGLVAYNCLAAEPVTKISCGRPMTFRTQNSHMGLANLFRAQLYAVAAPIRVGNDILTNGKKDAIEKFTAHGGLFKVEGVAQQVIADALQTSVTVMETAGEGGAWGMALLAAYMMKNDHLSLGDWLEHYVFRTMNSKTVQPNEDGVKGFNIFMQRYMNGADAVNHLENVK